MDNLIGKGKCITERHEKDIERSKKKLVCEERTNTSGEKEYILEGIVASADEDSNNGNDRRYDLEDMKIAVENYKTNFVDKKCSWGEVEHPSSAMLNMDRIGLIVTDIWMEGKDVYAKIRLLDLPITNIIREMLRVGANIGISSRIIGDLIDMGEYTLVTNFDIVSFDLVATPSNPTSWLSGIQVEKEYVVTEGVVMESKQYFNSQVTERNAREKKLPKQEFKYLDSLSNFL